MSLLQEQCRRLKDKVQLKSEVIRRQEALVLELRQRAGDAEQRVTAAELSSQSAHQKEDAAKTELGAAKQRLAEAEALIESNQKVMISIRGFPDVFSHCMLYLFIFIMHICFYLLFCAASGNRVAKPRNHEASTYGHWYVVWGDGVLRSRTSRCR